MSAFLVSDKTMNNVVNCISRKRDRFCSMDTEESLLTNECKNLDKIGNELFKMNQAALATRYGDNDEPPTFKYRPVTPVADIQAIKSMDCLLYQASEGNVPDTRIYKELEALRDEVMREYVIHSVAYNKAKWNEED